jgi:hypothetical protein
MGLVTAATIYALHPLTHTKRYFRIWDDALRKNDFETGDKCNLEITKLHKAFERRFKYIMIPISILCLLLMFLSVLSLK